MLVIGGGFIYSRYFYLPNYHAAVNQSDIKDIRIDINGQNRVIPSKDWSSLVREFNSSKMVRVRNLDVSYNTVVLFAFNDGTTLNFAVNGNEIRVSRLIGQKKVDYIAKNDQIINSVRQIYNGT
jgi:hypothetical protein